MKIIQTQDSIYQSAIVALYIEAFGNGASRQLVVPDEVDAYIKMILEKGYALLAIDKKQVIGATLCFPLALDNLVPSQIRQNFSIEKCVYVAEMMVGALTRGQGIGNKLMAAFFETIDKSRYSEAFIRVWDQNIPALNLYRKVGFEPVATIEHTKKKADGTGTFTMNKIYLHKKLD
jgi:GNAT superfamily N-acetyltransferase